MRIVFCCLLALTVTAPHTCAADRPSELFDAWQAAQRDFQSLVVEFTVETKSLTFGTSSKARGTLRLLRTKKGDLLGSYEVVDDKPKSPEQGKQTGLLHDKAIYGLKHDKKEASRLDPKGDVIGYLERHLNPFVLLLDRKRAEERYRLTVRKQDERYTYLTVKPRQPDKRMWSIGLGDGQIVLMNKDSKTIPKNMPRQLWYKDKSMTYEYTIDVQAWRWNAANPPRPEEFTRPEDRPGWKVFPSPFGKE